MDYAKESLRLHGEWKGKIEVNATVPVETKDDLSLATVPRSLALAISDRRPECRLWKENACSSRLLAM